MDSRLNELFFSQSALGAFLNCQLKFRRRYLDGLFWPGSWALDAAGREALEHGRLFHLLAQRYFSSGEEKDYGLVPLQDWFRLLREFRSNDPSLVFQPEQELRLNSRGMKLMAKFDLLAFAPDGRVLVYDWKTSDSVPKQEYCRKHLQTLVYRYVVCAAGEACSPYGKVEPEAVSMLYWNPRHPGTPVVLPYSRRQFTQDEEYLRKLVGEIVTRNPAEFFATTDVKRCRHCEYAAVCLGERAAEVDVEEDEDDLSLDWDSIDEIAPL